jgi:hypothetical protein
MGKTRNVFEILMGETSWKMAIRRKRESRMILSIEIKLGVMA